MHGQFIREMTEKADNEKTWQWLSRGGLKVGTEALLCAAQEQATRTSYMKYHIDKTSESPLCRLWEFQHNNVAKKVHWDIFKKNRLEHSEKWYEHVPEGAAENEDVKILWDISIQCDNLIDDLT